MNGDVVSRPRWPERLWSGAKVVFYLGLILLGLQQMCAPARLAQTRARALELFQQQRKSRVIAMIHRRETVSFLGVPVSTSINIEDSEAVLRAIRLTPPDQPIDLILHTPGGLVLAAEQIARALVRHKGPVTVFVPHYAMSGGTLLALTATQIVMDQNAVLGPVDPQIGTLPAASIIAVSEKKKPDETSDELLILADIAVKARRQMAELVTEIVSKRASREHAVELALALTQGRWTHDYPITVEAARDLGLPVSTEMPAIIYQLMELYPQAGSGRPSVLYVPMAPRPMQRGQEPGQ